MAKLFANSGDPVLRRLIWVCTVCQIHVPFYGSPDYSGLIPIMILDMHNYVHLTCWIIFFQGCLTVYTLPHDSVRVICFPMLECLILCLLALFACAAFNGNCSLEQIHVLKIMGKYFQTASWSKYG